MGGRIIPSILGKGWRFPGNGLLTVDLGIVMVPLSVSFSLLIEDQGLVEVDLSAI